MKNWIRKLTPIDWTYRHSWRGTYQQFGFRSFITIASPLANTILNWKYRNYGLEINEPTPPVGE